VTERVSQLRLSLDTGPGTDAEEWDDLTRQLRSQLLELDIKGVDHMTAGQAPPGTRGNDAWVAGVLIVSLVQSSGLFTALIDMIQSWISCIGGRSVRLEIDGDMLEVTGIGSRDQRKLIQAWIDRHTDW